MGAFPSKLNVQAEANGKTWVMLNDFQYQMDSEGVITVPAGFRTDFTSVPRPFWAVISRWGKHGFGAVVHDWLYWDQKNYTRAQADWIFLEAMTTSGVIFVKRWIMFAMVRLTGCKAWRDNARNRKVGLKDPPTNRSYIMETASTWIMAAIIIAGLWDIWKLVGELLAGIAD